MRRNSGIKQTRARVHNTADEWSSSPGPASRATPISFLQIEFQRGGRRGVAWLQSGCRQGNVGRREHKHRRVVTGSREDRVIPLTTSNLKSGNSISVTNVYIIGGGGEEVLVQMGGDHAACNYR